MSCRHTVTLWVAAARPKGLPMASPFRGTTIGKLASLCHPNDPESLA
jgi:hypothetical protein